MTKNLLEHLINLDLFNKEFVSFSLLGWLKLTILF